MKSKQGNVYSLNSMLLKELYVVCKNIDFYFFAFLSENDITLK